MVSQGTLFYDVDSVTLFEDFSVPSITLMTWSKTLNIPDNSGHHISPQNNAKNRKHNTPNFSLEQVLGRYTPAGVVYFRVVESKTVNLQDRLHINPLCGIFYVPWHRHEIDGTNGFLVLVSPPKDTGNMG